MKRPIAELLSVAVRAGAESERTQYDHEAWQILRRKQGYVTHRIYYVATAPLQRLIYSEWDGRKAVDGARQHLQGTPLERRARAVLTTAPERLVVELVGPLTSTKGLDLPEGSIAARAVGRLVRDGSTWRAREERMWQALAASAGHITHVVFRGFQDPLFVGSFSHWTDGDAFEKARVEIDPIAEDAIAGGWQYLVYKPVAD